MMLPVVVVVLMMVAVVTSPGEGVNSLSPLSIRCCQWHYPTANTTLDGTGSCCVILLTVILLPNEYDDLFIYSCGKKSLCSEFVNIHSIYVKILFINLLGAPALLPFVSIYTSLYVIYNL